MQLKWHPKETMGFPTLNSSKHEFFGDFGSLLQAG
jgi:hypothetical protein